MAQENPDFNKVPIKTPLLIGVANGQVMRMRYLSVGFFRYNPAVLPI